MADLSPLRLRVAEFELRARAMRRTVQRRRAVPACARSAMNAAPQRCRARADVALDYPTSEPAVPETDKQLAPPRASDGR